MEIPGYLFNINALGLCAYLEMIWIDDIIFQTVSLSAKYILWFYHQLLVRHPLFGDKPIVRQTSCQGILGQSRNILWAVGRSGWLHSRVSLACIEEDLSRTCLQYFAVMSSCGNVVWMWNPTSLSRHTPQVWLVTLTAPGRQYPSIGSGSIPLYYSIDSIN